MRITKSSLEERVKILENVLELPEGYSLHLSCYNPGDYARYQVEMREDTSYAIHYSFPRNYHVKARDMKWYLEGLLDALWEVPQIEKLIKNEK